MAKPIDLSAYAHRSVDFLIDGKMVKCPELSYKDLRRINEYEKKKDSTHEDELEIVTWLLNRNTSGKKFGKNDVEAMPAGAVARIYQEIIMLHHKALTDPN
ncbi:MAG: hypothetical protein HFE82_06800 [Erysipelotrichaceae bacterium]|nr:hypothetical protein [Erysipelotrichaceae bacterium]